MFTIETKILTEFTFKVCYGYCKMTVSDEHNNSNQYMRLQWVEFLELIGRVANAHWVVNKEHL